MPNKTIRLYKFRSLADCRSFEHTDEIIRDGNFYYSKFSDLNDPMEGSFTSEDVNIINAIYSEKNKTKICSFSSEEAFSNPLMWGHYAGGFKGAAIEISVDEGDMKKIEYKENKTDLFEIDGGDAESYVDRILTTKLIPWGYECEYRSLKKNENAKHKVGTITAIYFGAPYEIAVNRENIRNNSDILKKFELNKKRILEYLANKESNVIECYDVKIECRDEMVLVKKDSKIDLAQYRKGQQ